MCPPYILLCTLHFDAVVQVMLSEHEAPSYTDQLFQQEDVARVAQHVLSRAADFIAQVTHSSAAAM